MDPVSFERLLDSHTTKVYNISHGSRGFFNHMSHGLIALYNLGADEKTLQDFVARYAKRLDRPEDHPEQLERPPSGDLGEVKGERKYFYHLLDHYLDKLDVTYGGEMVAAIRGELPNLADGMLCAAFHGIIHLGYGFLRKHPRILAEGLATLHYAHVKIDVGEQKLVESLGSPGDLAITDVLQSVKEDVELNEYLKDTSENLQGPMAGRFPNRFSRGIAVLLQLRPNDLMKYVDHICMPSSYHNVLRGDLQSLGDMCDWIINVAITVYTLSENANDFFFIHGVTASWCLKPLVSSMTDIEDINKLIRIFLCGLIATYLVQDCPALHPDDVNDSARDPDTFWRDAVKDALKQGELDVHIYKLIDVFKAMSNVNMEKELDVMYRAAAKNALYKPIFRVK